MSMFSGMRWNNGGRHWIVNLMKYNFEMHKIFHNWNKTEMLKYYGGLTYWKLDRAHKEERCHPHKPFCHLRITTDHSNPVNLKLSLSFPSCSQLSLSFPAHYVNLETSHTFDGKLFLLFHICISSMFWKAYHCNHIFPLIRQRPPQQLFFKTNVFTLLWLAILPLRPSSSARFKLSPATGLFPTTRTTRGSRPQWRQARLS